MGLDGIAQDSIIPDIEENEFTEKPTGAIPKNLTDPLGLEEDEKAKKRENNNVQEKILLINFYKMIFKSLFRDQRKTSSISSSNPWQEKYSEKGKISESKRKTNLSSWKLYPILWASFKF